MVVVGAARARSNAARAVCEFPVRASWRIAKARVATPSPLVPRPGWAAAAVAGAGAKTTPSRTERTLSSMPRRVSFHANRLRNSVLPGKKAM